MVLPVVQHGKVQHGGGETRDQRRAAHSDYVLKRIVTKKERPSLNTAQLYRQSLCDEKIAEKYVCLLPLYMQSMAHCHLFFKGARSPV